jgi:hypothetical protein
MIVTDVLNKLHREQNRVTAEFVRVVPKIVRREYDKVSSGMSQELNQRASSPPRRPGSCHSRRSIH